MRRSSKWGEVADSSGMKRAGDYTYLKDAARSVDVAVHVVKVDRETEDYCERSQRTKVWMTPANAAAMVAEPELKALFATLVAKVVLNSQDKAILKKVRASRRIPLPGDVVGVAI